MQVQNFTYNGFYGTSEEGLAEYTAQFNRWTNDPGIAMTIRDFQTKLMKVEKNSLVYLQVLNIPSANT